jgi:hypothetical protein
MTDGELDASAAVLTHALLDEEATRLGEQAQAAKARVLADEELPGVGDASMSLREAVQIGGLALLASPGRSRGSSSRCRTSGSGISMRLYGSASAMTKSSSVRCASAVRI